MEDRKLYGRINVLIKSAKNIPKLDAFGGDSDPFVLVALDGVEKGRTSVKRDEPNPVWGEWLHVHLDGHQGIKDVTFQVWDEDRLRSDDFIGQFSFSCDEIAQITGDYQEMDVPLKAKDGTDLKSTIQFDIQFVDFSQSYDKDNGPKKALFIGINYNDMPEGGGKLNGCVNDVQNMLKLVVDKYGYEEDTFKILTDDDSTDEDSKPTKANILAALEWLTADAAPGDRLFFHYSGHGCQVDDKDGDEEDGKDETIVPMDFRSSGMIVDDVMRAKLVDVLPPGVKLTCVMDCCHSGTGMDLPYVHMAKADRELLLGEGESRGIEDEIMDFFGTEAVARSIGGSGKADVVLLSGCRDDQTSADAWLQGASSGAMTAALTTIINSTETITYRELISKMREFMNSGGHHFTQIPQISTEQPFSLDRPFLI
eukprot:CAMPEP_0174252318 /NCGR_PEP_ID=MMETSP0439-20130205/1838_1 /TAXON_ID=0 /ORGANISM="Stereomyxa ramosa, Strain Chinc5" /LENGTH=424 /DNA_ID=CAMNT_0015332835 /DNA_START=38 /DNA_END=1312 /DNA_ORIENTATION=+